MTKKVHLEVIEVSCKDHFELWGENFIYSVIRMVDENGKPIQPLPFVCDKCKNYNRNHKYRKSPKDIGNLKVLDNRIENMIKRFKDEKTSKED